MNSVKVYTAIEPTQKIKSDIEAFVRKKTGGEYEISYYVRKELIGGVRIEIGDVVYDGTVRRKLQIVGDKV